MICRPFRRATSVFIRLIATAALVVPLIVIGPVTHPAAASAPVASALDTKLACAFTQNSVTELQNFSWLVGRTIDCASVFNDTATTWAAWEDPWFAHMPADQPQYAWRKWLSGAPRTLVISQSLVPSGIDPDWRAQGLAGAYDTHIQTLAQNLVSYGMGDTIIRLAHEGNGNWSYDDIGSTAAEHADWKAYWAHFVSVMRSVPGTSFEFDWTVNAASPAIPFDDYYPGDAAVDLVGIDQYDWASAWVGTAQPARWNYQRDIALGMSALVGYAAAHGKPVSIPEWGLVPTSIPEGMGDDAYFADQIAGVVGAGPVRYQSYFNATSANTMRLQDVAGSRASWKRHFGAGGDSWAPTPATPPPPPPQYPPVDPRLDTKAACVDEKSSVAALQSVGWVVGRPLQCAVLHNENPASWPNWTDPWVTRPSAPPNDYQWAGWLAAAPASRTLVLVQSLVPTDAPSDWRTRGAAGEYDSYYTALGNTLVARGFGHLVIRLAPKANGNWAVDNVGTTAADFAAWRAYWARAAGILRSTPGSSFSIEWNLSAGFRPIPLDQIYPGDGAVDVVGAAQYDSAPGDVGARQPDRWNSQLLVPGSLTQVIGFARTHGKPIAITEWASVLVSRGDGAGDDAYYADQIAALVRQIPSRYQAYVNTGTGIVRLQDGAATRASWKRHFGVGGDSLGSASG